MEKEGIEMIAIIVLICLLAGMKIGQRLIILLLEALATAIAAYYSLLSTRISREMLSGRPSNVAAADPAWAVPSRRQRRLMARHLQLSLAMTAQYSLFPRSTPRDYALAHALVRRFC